MLSKVKTFVHGAGGNTGWVSPVDEHSSCLTELAYECRLFLGDDLRLGGQWWLRRRPGKLALLFVLPGLQGALKCLKHRHEVKTSAGLDQDSQNNPELLHLLGLGSGSGSGSYG